jgi:hypothetical protein
MIGSLISTGAVRVLAEPVLEFRYRQGLIDPRDGLTAFGPYDTDLPSHPQNVSLGVVATPNGLAALSTWHGALRGPIEVDSSLDSRLWPLFPGFEAAFHSSWPTAPTRTLEIDEQALSEGVAVKDGNKRVAAVVELYLDGIRRMRKSGDPLDVVVCVVPDAVWQACRPLSRVPHGEGYAPSAAVRRQRAAGQMDFFDNFDPRIYRYSLDFRRQLKARSMEYDLPIQIIRESTLRLGAELTFGDRRLTPLSDRAWNLSTALYYKAGGKPWRLTTAREGVCYIGIAYRLSDPSANSTSACCAAQMFLDTGDGIIFMGEFGPWYSPETRQFHLSPSSAKNLLEGVLKTYRDLEGKQLKEIFLHSRSGIGFDEFAGFQDACPAGVKLVGVRVRRWIGGFRLYREGTRPVLRGTYWKLTERSACLWGAGFKPRLATYDGSETPWPLKIDVQHGDADIDLVTQDILGLTKLNYNACRLGESEPITVGFSDAVGEILVSNPTVEHRQPQFKFYI